MKASVHEVPQKEELLLFLCEMGKHLQNFEQVEKLSMEIAHNHELSLQSEDICLIEQDPLSHEVDGFDFEFVQQFSLHC